MPQRFANVKGADLQDFLPLYPEKSCKSVSNILVMD